MSESLAFCTGSFFHYALSLSLFHRWLARLLAFSCYSNCGGCSSFLCSFPGFECVSLHAWKSSKNIALIFTTFICTVIEFHWHKMHVLLGLYCVLHCVWLNVLISNSCLWCEPCLCVRVRVLV